MSRDQERASLLYADVGVDSTRVGIAGDHEEYSLSGLLSHVRRSFTLRSGPGSPLLPLGYFANVLDLGHGLGLAISTDGVGTKILIAQMMERYDTVGIDCVAMNVNDVVCVGAEPIAMTDYLAVQVPDPALLSEIGKGLLDGARLAGVTIPGGELAQVPDMVHGASDGHAFDLVGTCVGIVPTDRILVGDDIEEHDLVIGLASSGIHSNGLTLARRALLDQPGMGIKSYVPELGRTVGEELLEPTRIYVSFALACLRASLPVKAFAHITSDGFLNLTRVRADVGYVIEHLPEVPAIFQVIQQQGGVTDEEMYRVFNMGIGFCAIAAPDAADAIIATAHASGHRAHVIGRATADTERTVRIVPVRLTGNKSTFRRY